MVRRNTRQKALVMQYLHLVPHASATMLYDRMCEDRCEISRATVFRVLSEAAEDGSILRLCTNGQDDRFDATVIPHSHVYCVDCGSMQDLMYQPDEAILSRLSEESGYEIYGCQLVYRGRCPQCRKAMQDREARAQDDTQNRFA